MKLKTKAALAVLAVILFAFIAVIVVHVRPLMKANDLLKAANSHATLEYYDNNVISRDHFGKLRIISDSDKEVYINGGVTFFAVKSLGFCTVSVEYKLSYTVCRADTNETVEQVKGTKTINFVLKNMKWTVDKVS